jgi:predicted nucleic acid-binding protein
VIVIADTGGIVAAMDPGEPQHDRFRETLESARSAVVTPLVIAEVHYLLSAAGEHLAASDFLDNVTSGFFDVADPRPEDYGTARKLIKKYEGKMERKRRKPGSLDLADAMNVVVAGSLGTHLIVATDQDYRVVQPLSGHDYFAILPVDEVHD